MLHQRFDSLIIIYQQIIFRLSLVTPFLIPEIDLQPEVWWNSRLEVFKHRNPAEYRSRDERSRGNVSFFAVLSSDWPGVVICWSPRCRRPEVGPWLFVQRRWLPTRAIWNDGGLWKMNSFLSLFLLLVQTANVLLSC